MVMTDYIKITVATIGTMDYGVGVPSAFYSNTFVYTEPLALGFTGLDRCGAGITIELQHEAFTATDVFGTSHTVDRWMDYALVPCNLAAIGTDFASVRHLFDFYGNTVDASGISYPTKYAACNPDGTWVITYTFDSVASTVLSGVTYNFVFHHVITFEPVP